ncbi:PA1414 family protein [Pseudomonas sp.]|nr:PA1414 family protein [Pseudomonas sp.]
MKTWFERLIAQLNEFFGANDAARLQPIRVVSEEQRRLAEERRRQRR